MRDTPPGEDTITKVTNWAFGNAEKPEEERDDKYWVALSRAAYDDSTDWLAGVRNGWDKSIALFQNQHPQGSKYHGVEFRNRSKVFRPKTRSGVRKGEAQAASAFFSTAQQCKISARDDSNPKANASAALWQEVLEYRLSTTIPWFLTVCGAMQDGQTIGLCISKQWWEYEEIADGEQQRMHTDEETGEQFEVHRRTGAGETEPVMDPAYKAVKDLPHVDLIPAENFRISAAADWRDPVNTSPYVQHEQPMFVGDIKARMEARDGKTGAPPWTKLTDAQIITGKKNIDDQTTASREKPRRDPRVASTELRDHEIVFVRTNIMRVDGQDWHYLTIGDHMLTKCVPLKEVYLHGMRPFVMGYVVFETHKTYPASKVMLGEGLQQEANDLVNLRLDNLKMSLHPRAKVKAGKNVPMNALRNGAPGEPLVLQNLDDMEWEKPPTVDAAAYAEQDRINTDMDEIGGNFSQSSVMTNRRMNETVGGMNLIAGAANTIGEYDLRVFTVTWVEPVLRQLVKLEQAYETDETILALGAREAQLAQRYGIDQVTDDLLDHDLLLTVNVGMGATDPKQRIERLLMAFGALGQITTPLIQVYGPQILQTPAWKEIAGEVFGAVGYKDPDRFLDFGMKPGDGQHGPKVAEAISFKDLPPQGQIQMAAQAGIKLDPSMFQQGGGPDPAQMQELQQKEQAHQQDMRHKEQKAQIDSALKVHSAQIADALKQHTAQNDAALKAHTTHQDNALKAHTANQDNALKAQAANRDGEIKTNAANRDGALKVHAAAQDGALKQHAAVHDGALKQRAADQDGSLKAQGASNDAQIKAQAAKQDGELKAQGAADQAGDKGGTAEIAKAMKEIAAVRAELQKTAEAIKNAVAEMSKPKKMKIKVNRGADNRMSHLDIN